MKISEIVNENLDEAGLKSKLATAALATSLGLGTGYMGAKMFPKPSDIPQAVQSYLGSKLLPPVEYEIAKPEEKIRIHVGYPRELLAPGSPQEVKHRFIQFFSPFVHKANEKVLLQRKHFLNLFEKLKNPKLSATQKQEINNEIDEKIKRLKILDLPHIKKISNLDQKNKAARSELIKQLDIIPIDLAISKAGVESGWGTSELAKTNLNFFGIKVGNEFKRFASVEDAVDYYIRLMNHSFYYQNFRDQRAKSKDVASKETTGREMFKGSAKTYEPHAPYSKILSQALSKKDVKAAQQARGKDD